MTEQKQRMTLCLIYNHPKILLGMKKRGFGKGRWNGFGGKVEEGESIEEAARREVKEEAGLDVSNLDKVGIIDFVFKGQSKTIEVHVFRAEGFRGQPVDSAEMEPKWFYVDEIPFRDMWPDDIYWFPLFLKNRKFKGKFLFDQEGKNILERDLEEVNNL